MRECGINIGVIHCSERMVKLTRSSRYLRAKRQCRAMKFQNTYVLGGSSLKHVGIGSLSSSVDKLLIMQTNGYFDYAFDGNEVHTCRTM